jgi:hypothetical protein
LNTSLEVKTQFRIFAFANGQGDDEKIRLDKDRIIVFASSNYLTAATFVVVVVVMSAFSSIIS